MEEKKYRKTAFSLIANQTFGWYTPSMDRRNIILKEASSIIATSGMESFSLSLLASRCGITKATLYNYYKSKDEIIISLIAEGHTAFMKQGFKLNLTGSVEDVLLSAASHWRDIFLSGENTSWLRIIFSEHLTNSLCQEEYRSIVLMLTSQAEVVISSFLLKDVHTASLTELFSSLLLTRLERTLEGEEILLEEECSRLAVLIEDLRQSRK